MTAAKRGLLEKIIQYGQPITAPGLVSISFLRLVIGKLATAHY